jgi:hypothetical protein
VKDAVASWLRSSDPLRYRMYRVAAWRQLRHELESADQYERWRYAADMMYLLQNPNVREAYFPSEPEVVTPEPARPEDETAILAIAEAHEPPTAAQIITHWWQRARDAFQVLRDTNGSVAGFYLVAEWPQIAPNFPESDPMACNWRKHLRDQPMGRSETAVYIRRWLSDSSGESPSRVQAACWMDVKRFYMRSRPHVRRCYVSLTDLATYGSPTAAVGFRVVTAAGHSFDGKPYHLAVLDFGINSIDGWVTALLARELGVSPTEILDMETRELVLKGKRVSLTALEFGFLSYLHEQEGRPVTRAELLERIWQQRADTGSNVVEAIVRGLRTKMGEYAWMIATVRGIGYRLQRNQPELTTR